MISLFCCPEMIEPPHESEVITIKTPVSRVGNKSAILHILYALFPLNYGRFIDVFGGSGSVLLGNPEICPFEVYNDFDRNLANLFRCMKERTMAVIRELGFCHLNSREDFIAIRRFFENEQFDDKYLSEELRLTQIMLPPLEAKELTEMRKRITLDYDVRRAAMFLKLLRFSYSSHGQQIFLINIMIIGNGISCLLMREYSGMSCCLISINLS